MGEFIGREWQKLAKKHGLDIGVLNIPSLITFKFNYGQKSQAIHTLFNQEMLERGYLVTKSVYLSYSHKEKDVKEYLKKVDIVFGVIKRAIKERKVSKLLKGPIAHQGFERLT